MQPPDEPTDTEAEPEAPTEGEEQPAEEQEGGEVEAKAEPEGEEAAAEEPAEGEEAAKPDEPAPEAAEEKRRRAGGWQRKIERLERQNAEKDQLIARLATPGQAPAGAKPAAEQTPEEKAAEYVRTMARQVVAEERQQAEMRQRQADFQRRTAEVRAKHPDFDEMLESVSHIPVHEAVTRALLTSEHGPAIMYELARDREALARLSALPPEVALMELGRLGAKLTSVATAPKTNGTARRPAAPPTSVRGTASSTRSLEDLPLSEYKRAMRSRQR